MTGIYSQLFLDNFGNLPPIVRALAAAADDMEMRLERLRIHCGFKDDWSPVHDRTVKSAAASATDVSWAKKCGLLNGMGDLGAFLQEMCGWMDTMGEKIADVESRIERKAEHILEPDILIRAMQQPDIGARPKRGPGRPRKDAA